MRQKRQRTQRKRVQRKQPRVRPRRRMKHSRRRCRWGPKDDATEPPQPPRTHTAAKTMPRAPAGSAEAQRQRSQRQRAQRQQPWVRPRCRRSHSRRRHCRGPIEDATESPHPLRTYTAAKHRNGGWQASQGAATEQERVAHQTGKTTMHQSGYETTGTRCHQSRRLNHGSCEGDLTESPPRLSRRLRSRNHHPQAPLGPTRWFRIGDGASEDGDGGQRLDVRLPGPRQDPKSCRQIGTLRSPGVASGTPWRLPTFRMGVYDTCGGGPVGWVVGWGVWWATAASGVSAMGGRQ